ncbi:unnamed protein product [Cylindrotheca closterium]|uniref:Heme oxygenase n=1 Tax=Cylindrotheca closterium TaxID=2856 RepID=A0AAD2CB04_9STRA|nr:unnamed protein product [Cylindrotheca closterium]
MSATNETTPITERMRKATHDVHETSDKLVNLKLAMVITSKPLYAEAISLFWPIYRELETLIEKHKDDSRLSAIYPLLPILQRAALFEKDMISLLENDEKAAELLKARRIRTDENGKETFSPPELQTYINHLRKLSEEQPILLIPYIYSMYGAIMAGGTAIKRMVKRAFSLKTDGGVEMFGIPLEGSDYKNVKEFRNDMKSKLEDEMELTAEEEVLILEEAPKVFIRNNALVATATDTEVFLNAWKKCRGYAGIAVAISIGIVLAVYYK